jgi:CHU_C Type IX secretion signal domain
MKQTRTLLTVFASLLISTAWSQSSANTHNHQAGEAAHHHETENDSLAGFNADSVMDIAMRAQLEPSEAAHYLAYSKQMYIAKKYDLNGINERGNGQIGSVTPQSACTNMGFETGDFSGWQGAIGDNNVNSLGPLQNVQVGFFTNGNDALSTDPLARHTIMTSAAGNDPCGGFPIVPANYGNYVIRLGNTSANYQGEILEQTFVVDPNTTQFTYRYAVVLNDGGHFTGEQPYFRIELLDSVGQPVSPCAQYYVEAGGSIPGFVSCGNGTSYKPWSTITVDLSAFVNNSITVRFTVGGCIFGGHYGYAYIDCSCSNLGDAVTATFCPGSPGAFLVAPTGFAFYQWFDPSGNPINGGTNDSLFVVGANPNDTFFVDMAAISDTSCHTTLFVVVDYTYLQTNPSGIDPTCYGYTDGSVTTSCANCFPPVNYSWTTSPVQTTQTATGLPGGVYIVTVTDSIGCTDDDTVTIVNPPRLDTAGITTKFCVGDPEITLIGIPGMPSYQWLDSTGTPIAGATNQSYLVASPTLGSTYYVIYGTTPCPMIDSIILNYVPPLNLFFPDSLVNVFTPNADMRNDYFYPYYDYSVASQTASSAGTPQYDFYNLYVGTFEVRVWDRWGVEVFYSNDYTIGWDGKVNGKEAIDGVYYWETRFTSRCKVEMEEIINTGFVHLMR